MDKLAPKLADLNQMPNYLLNIANTRKHDGADKERYAKAKVVKGQGRNRSDYRLNRELPQPGIHNATRYYRQIRIGDMLTAGPLLTALLLGPSRTLVSSMERHAGRADTAANTVLGATVQLKSLWGRARKSSIELSRKL